MQKFIFDGINKLFIAKTGVIEFDVQIDLYSDWKEELLVGDNLKYEQAMRSVGGDPISETRNLGDTYFLINDWKIRPFESGHRLTIDGNLFSEDGTSVIVSTTGNHQVIVEMQVSNLVDSTVAQLDITNLQYLIESQRDLNRGYGSIFYVDPINGNNGNNGLSPQGAFKTINYAISQTNAGQGDVIFVINLAVGQTTITEDIVIDKAGVSLRGPGPAICLKSNTSTNTITINAEDISVDGFCIKNDKGSNSIQINAGRCLIQNNVFDEDDNHSIQITAGLRIIIRDNHLHDGFGAIHIEGYGANAPHGTVIERNVLHDFVKYGIEIKGDVDDVKILNNNIYNNQTGVYIGSGVTHTNIAENNIILENTVSDIVDSGTNTINDLYYRPAAYIQLMKDTIYTHSSGTVGLRFEDALMEVLAMANGKIQQRSSGIFDFYDRDNTNVVFTLIETTGTRYRE